MNRAQLRVKRSRDEAKKNYNRQSRLYDWLMAPSEERPRQDGLAALDVQPGERVLEVCCGTGQALAQLAGAVSPSGLACGLDLAEGMLKVSQRRLAKAGLENVPLCEGDAIHLPYSSRCFDAVFISFALELFDTPEIPMVLAACRRVLRPDGRLGVVALRKRPVAAVAIYEFFHTLMPVLVDCRPIYLNASLEASSFEVKQDEITKMWGLPVGIVVARVRN